MNDLQLALTFFGTCFAVVAGVSFGWELIVRLIDARASDG